MKLFIIVLHSQQPFCGNNVCHRRSDTFGHWNVKELIRAVRIGPGAQYTCNHKLRAWPNLVQQRHERNTTPFSDVGCRFTPQELRCLIETRN
jgi:hypothetical protein